MQDIYFPLSFLIICFCLCFLQCINFSFPSLLLPPVPHSSPPIPTPFSPEALSIRKAKGKVGNLNNFTNKSFKRGEQCVDKDGEK